MYKNWNVGQKQYIKTKKLVVDKRLFKNVIC